MKKIIYVAALAVCFAGSAIGQELTVQQAITMRQAAEVRALLLDRNLDDRDVRLLSDIEVDSTPAALNSTDKLYLETPSQEFPTRAVAPANAPPRYRYWFKSAMNPPRYAQRDLAVDDNLPKPKIEIDLSDPLYPLVRVSQVPNNAFALYYFEFDTDPGFNSPNFWRYPNLKPTYLSLLANLTEEENFRNLTSRAGLSFDVFRAAQRDVSGRSNEVRFPFRSTAMRLPQWNEMNFAEMERQALALGFGLQTKDVIAEIQRYGRHTYVWGSDTATRPPLDTFRSGIGECNAIGMLVGTLLEMNGIRYRVVSGFNPKFRVISPAGGAFRH